MRRSEFRTAVADEFGPRATWIVADLVLGDLGGVTANEALARGVDAGEVWLALCRAAEVPRERWHGAGLKEPRRER